MGESARRNYGQLIATAGVCVALATPMAMSYGLKTRLNRLCRVASETLRQPISMDSVDATLDLQVLFDNIRVGNTLTAPRARVLSSFETIFEGAPPAIELLAPRIELSANYPRQPKTTSSLRSSKRTMPIIMVRQGTLILRDTPTGSITADDFSLLLTDDGTRIVTGPLSLPQGSQHKPQPFFHRAAVQLDPQLHLKKLIAEGGPVPELNIQQSLVTYGISRDQWDASFTTTGGGTIGLTNQTPTMWTGKLRNANLGLLSRLTPFVDGKKATANGQVLVDLDGQTLRWSGEITEVSLVHDNIAGTPMPVSFSGEIQVNKDEAGRQQLALDGRVNHIAMNIALAAQEQWFDITLSVPRQSCAAILKNLPAPARGALNGMQLTGHIQGTLSFRSSQRTGLAQGSNGCRVEKDAESASPTSIRQGLHSHEALPPYLAQAFLSGEDGRFYRHNGFDLRQIRNSLLANYSSKSLKRGGSTITQQLVKNRFLDHERTLARKIQEAILTWRVEQVLDKNEILAAYLDIIELGPNVQGIHDAATYWFGKPVRKLSLREAAFLAALTPAPKTLTNRVHDLGKLPPELKRRTDNILTGMHRDGHIDAVQLAQALDAPLRLSESSLMPPAFARH